MDTVEQIPVGPCDYCGRENPDRRPACPGCGKPYVQDTQPKQKSKGWAYGLAIVLGPAGLIYIRAWWPAFVLIVLRVPSLLTHTAVLWTTIGVRLFSVVTVWHHFSEEEPNARREANRLLDVAAKLEKTDRTAAITTYQEIIRLYPNTPASTEAEQNIKILSPVPVGKT